MQRIAQLSLLTLTLLTGSALASPELVTSWVTTTPIDTSNTWIDGSGKTNSGRENIARLNFANIYSTVSSFTTPTNNYVTSAGLKASDAFIRRGAVGSNSINMMVLTGIYDGSTNQETTRSTAYANVEELLLSGSLQNGIADAFANVNTSGDGGPVNTERIDFVWQNGYVVTGDEAITLFNLDPLNNQDEFRIAAFTSLGTTTITGLGNQNNVPTTYASTGILITENLYNAAKLPLPVVANGGTPNSTTTSWNNVQFKDGSGDNFQVGIDKSNAIIDNQTTGATASGIGGVVIKLTDLGLSVGQTFYGYSLMSTDVNPGTQASNLVDWRNATVFPTNTQNNTGGTADFITFGAQLFQPVPEPAHYGLLSFGGLAACLSLRRRGLRKAPSA